MISAARTLRFDPISPRHAWKRSRGTYFVKKYAPTTQRYSAIALAATALPLPRASYTCWNSSQLRQSWLPCSSRGRVLATLFPLHLLQKTLHAKCLQCGWIRNLDYAVGDNDAVEVLWSPRDGTSFKQEQTAVGRTLFLISGLTTKRRICIPCQQSLTRLPPIL